MIIYRIENCKGQGPFLAGAKWDYPRRKFGEIGYSYRDHTIICDNGYRFGITTKDQYNFFNFDQIIGNEFTIQCYDVPDKHIIHGLYDVAFDYHHDSVMHLGCVQDIPATYLPPASAAQYKNIVGPLFR